MVGIEFMETKTDQRDCECAFSLKNCSIWFTRILFSVAFAATAPKAEAGVTFRNLHSFGVFTNGANPQAALVQGSDGNLAWSCNTKQLPTL